RLDELRTVRQQLANLLLQGQGPLSTTRYRERCNALQERHDALERALAEDVGAFAELRAADRAGPAELAGRLPAGVVHVEFVRYQRINFRNPAGLPSPACYAALLRWPGADAAAPHVRFVPLGEAAPMEEAIHVWRQQVQKGTVAESAERELRQRLWGPLVRTLPAKTTGL